MGRFINLLSSEDQPSIAMFKDSLDTEKIVMSGHSFGGATTIMAVAKDDRFTAGVSLDGWLFSLRDEHLKITKPLLFIDAETFNAKENLEKKMEYLPMNPDNKHLSIRGAIHQSYMDTPLMFKASFIKKIAGMHSLTCPDKVLAINNRLMLQFIWQRLGLPQDAEVREDIRKNSSFLSCFDIKNGTFNLDCSKAADGVCQFHSTPAGENPSL